MHRFVAFLLSCLYLTAFSGATVTVHYCAGSVSSVSIDEAYQDKSCGKCETKQKSCCQEKQTVLQVSSNHEPVTQSFSFEKAVPVLANEFYNLFQPVQLTPYYLSCLDGARENGPPLPLYISYCNYRV